MAVLMLTAPTRPHRPLPFAGVCTLVLAPSNFRPSRTASPQDRLACLEGVHGNSSATWCSSCLYSTTRVPRRCCVPGSRMVSMLLHLVSISDSLSAELVCCGL